MHHTSGVRSRLAQQLSEAHGITNAKNFSGGMNQWLQENKDTEKI